MPKVGADNEALYERLIFAYDGSDYRVVRCDAEGNIVAAVLADQVVEVTQDTAADLKATVDISADQNVQARAYGWIGSAWQKSPLALGYSGRGAEEKSNTNAAVGFDALQGTQVPAGEIWIVHAASARDVTTDLGTIGILAVVAGVDVYMLSENPAGANIPVAWSGEIVLAQGDRISAAFFGTVAGDDIYLDYAYTRVDIDQ